jgi:outer membrane protein
MLNTNTLLKSVALLSSLLIAGSVVAQTKVGFVSTERILKESNPAQEAQKTLMGEFSAREKKLEDAAGELKRKSERLERDAQTMSATERQRLQAEVASGDAAFQRERRNLEEEVQSRRSQLLSAILERANREIIKIAEVEKIDIVFQEAVWASPRIDLTNKVLDALKR